MDQKIPGLDDVVLAVEPKTRNATITTDALAVDLAGLNAAEVAIVVGLWTDGTHTFSLQDSPDGITYTTVAAGSYFITGNLAITTFVVNSTLTDQTVLQVGYRGTKRYLKVICTVAGSPSTGLCWGACVSKGLKNQRT